MRKTTHPAPTGDLDLVAWVRAAVKARAGDDSGGALLDEIGSPGDADGSA
jgi:hypothetical protein